MNIVFLSILLLIGGLAFILMYKFKGKTSIKLPKLSIPNPIGSVPIPQSPVSKSEWGSFESKEEPKEEPKKKAVSPGNDTLIFKKTNFNLNILVGATAFIGFLCFVFAYLNPKMSFFALLVGSVIVFPFGMLIGAMMSGNMRVKVIRMVSKKNYGFVKFVHSNRLIKTIITNLDSDTIKFAGGLYIVEKNHIKREGAEQPSTDEIQEQKIKFEEGIPTIYYDIDDIMPIDFKTIIEKDPGDKYRLPTQVSATLNKEIAVEKAKVMNTFASRQSMLLFIIIALCLVNVYMGFTTSSDMKKMKDAINLVNNNVAQLRAFVIQAFQQLGSINIGG